ncbi:MAG: tRNA dihydrouridine(20/20a) synthase DusA [Gammaproteobacteria bacterium]|nr:tRNA dihydrouridine(20/20a) synthase DusA [Gammaproteobacteria bacterium]
MNNIDRRFSVAPMMDWTDKHCRYLLRLMFPEALLYTEMVVTGAILYGERARFLDFNAAEHPLALQLGGSDPAEMAACARIAQDWGYNEVNINVGCPSDRVQAGIFGACLMAQPQRVADCVRAMRDQVEIPVTVKCRLGIDDMDDYDDLRRFVDHVAAAGCEVFIVHARKAWLQGLSPKENREVPPLMYDNVYRLKRERTDLSITINGGIKTVDDCVEHLNHVDGVMIGREVYNNPFALLDVRRQIFGATNLPSRVEIVERYIPYIESQLANDVFLKYMTRPMLGLFQGMPGARHWRRYICEQVCNKTAGINVLHNALQIVLRNPEFVSSSTEVVS